ncbi:MAG: hypothetical protein HUK20_09065 [Fibrobacter sp.]|nr:hypothetical protein [Fibrobacter sp.]
MVKIRVSKFKAAKEGLNTAFCNGDFLSEVNALVTARFLKAILRAISFCSNEHPPPCKIHAKQTIVVNGWCFSKKRLLKGGRRF